MCGTTQKGFLTPPANRGLHPNIPNTDRLRKFIATFCAFQYCVVRVDFATIDRLHIIICLAAAVAVPPRRAAARPPPCEAHRAEAAAHHRYTPLHLGEYTTLCTDGHTTYIRAIRWGMNRPRVSFGAKTNFVFVVSSISQGLHCEQIEWAHRNVFRYFFLQIFTPITFFFLVFRNGYHLFFSQNLNN